MALCGAKTRSGDTCKNNAMVNGRCRMHGGKSTGAPKANKNAVTTGEYESILYDVLDPDERVLFDGVSVDVLAQLDEQIRTISIRERRMLQRIQKIKEEEFGITEMSVEDGVGIYENKVHMETTKHIAAIERIQHIEEALTRVQALKIKALQQKFDVLKAGPDDEERKLRLEKLRAEIAKLKSPEGEEQEDDGFMHALHGEASEVWGDDDGDDSSAEES